MVQSARYHLPWTDFILSRESLALPPCKVRGNDPIQTFTDICNITSKAVAPSSE